MAQPMQTICPMLPPFADIHANHKDYLYCQSHHINAPMCHSTNPSFQNVPTTQTITQPPKKPFIGRKTIVDKAQNVMS